MARVIVLGGCGGIGSTATRALIVGGHVDEVVIADLRGDLAEAAAASYGRPEVTGRAVDVSSPADLAAALADVDVVVNCVGPFYRFGAPVLQAAIDAGVAYVDICDDLDATQRQLALDEAARAAGVTAVIGIGNSPGLANVLVRFAADHLLDVVERVDIMHIHGGEAEEGPAVIKHRIHAMTNDVPVYVDGAFRDVRLLEESGQEFVEPVEFRDVGTYPVYPYPHPETITLPVHLPGLQRVTNRGVVFPHEYFAFTMATVAEGLARGEGGSEEEIDTWVDTILGRRAELLADAGVTGPAGCLRIDITGRQGGEEHTYVFSLSSTTDGAGEGTGIPAALAAIQVARGDLVAPGVHPPEAVVDPVAMMALAGEVIPHFGIGDGGGVPIHVEHRRPDGTVEEIALDL